MFEQNVQLVKCIKSWQTMCT